ncbi:hypothetical protein niasHT_036211 [Heterodera trifolii]|uniref:Amyloidogenic glycoprotein heparin-binding domain-containing protein n=1 Tax=Heterodera trifolii TaxID=157864 RepID=A0ABD2J0N2_9BILA
MLQIVTTRLLFLFVFSNFAVEGSYIQQKASIFHAFSGLSVRLQKHIYECGGPLQDAANNMVNCFAAKHDILKQKITNVVECSHLTNIGHWGREDGTDCQGQFTVQPLRCIHQKPIKKTTVDAKLDHDDTVLEGSPIGKHYEHLRDGEEHEKRHEECIVPTPAHPPRTAALLVAPDGSTICRLFIGLGGQRSNGTEVSQRGRLKRRLLREEKALRRAATEHIYECGGTLQDAVNSMVNCFGAKPDILNGLSVRLQKHIYECGGPLQDAANNMVNCFAAKHDILKQKITNVVECSHLTNIGHWGREDGTDCQGQFTVQPLRCIHQKPIKKTTVDAKLDHDDTVLEGSPIGKHYEHLRDGEEHEKRHEECIGEELRSTTFEKHHSERADSGKDKGSTIFDQWLAQKNILLELVELFAVIWFVLTIFVLQRSHPTDASGFIKLSVREEHNMALMHLNSYENPIYSFYEGYICNDVWMDTLPFFDHAQLGLKMALLSPRFDVLVDKHFDDGKTKLMLWRLIKIHMSVGLKSKLNLLCCANSV